METFKKYAAPVWKLLVSGSSLYLTVWGIGKISKDIIEASHSSIGDQCGKVKKNFWG